LSESVVVTKLHGAVLEIVLNRPDSFNAFDEEMGLMFLEALILAEDPSVRAVLVIGEGKAFCAGEDLKSLSGDYAEGKTPALGEILRRRYNPAITKIRQLEKPVVAAINGVAAGAGVSLALACDRRVMSSGAKLALAFSSVGLIPDAGATWLLPRYLGIGRAIQMATSSEPIGAEQALDLGLVEKVVQPDEVAAAAMSLAQALSQGPTAAFGLTKRLLWESFESDFASHLEAEASAQSIAGSSDDHIEGVRAFMAKRSPIFGGR